MTVRAGATLVLALAALPAGAAGPDPLAGHVAGVAKRCVDLDSNEALVAVDERTIVHRESARRTWVTHPVGPCPGLAAGATLIVDRFGSQVCRDDRFRTIRIGQSIPSAVCRFDVFTPYDRPRRAP